MRKKLFAIVCTAAFLAFAAAPAARAQVTPTLVSATITDPNGVPYSGARVTVTLNSPGGQSPYLTPCSAGPGCQIQNPSPVTTDSSGNFQIALYPNGHILPSPSTYTFTVVEPGVLLPWGTGPQQFTLAAQTISGASQSLTSAFEAVPPPDLTQPFAGTGPGGAAIKPAQADGQCFVTTEGNDANDGLSWGTAKLTVNGCVAELPSKGGNIYVGVGTFTDTITLSKAIKLIGTGPAVGDGVNSATNLTIANSTNTPVITVTHGNVRITSVTITGNGSHQTTQANVGISVTGDVDGIEIDHDSIEDTCWDGVAFTAGISDALIHDNFFSENGRESVCTSAAAAAAIRDTVGQDSNVQIYNNTVDESFNALSSCFVFSGNDLTTLEDLFVTVNNCNISGSATIATQGVLVTTAEEGGGIGGNEFFDAAEGTSDLSTGVLLEGEISELPVYDNNLDNMTLNCAALISTGGEDVIYNETVSGNTAEGSEDLLIQSASAAEENQAITITGNVVDIIKVDASEGSLEGITITGNTVQEFGSPAKPGIFINGAVTDSTVTGNSIIGNSNSVGAGIQITGASNNLVASNTLVGFAGTGAGAIGIDITNSAATDNCIGVNEFNGVTTPVSDSGTGTGSSCAAGPNGAGGGGANLAFTNKLFAPGGGQLSVSATTTTVVDSLTLTALPAACGSSACRLRVTYNYYGSGGVVGVCYVSDGGADWDQSQALVLNNHTPCGASALSPEKFSAAATPTVTVSIYDSGALDVCQYQDPAFTAATCAVGSGVQGYLQVEVVESN